MATAKQLAALKKGREAMAKKRAAGTVKKRVTKKPAAKRAVKKNPTKRRSVAPKFVVEVKLRGNQIGFVTSKGTLDTEIEKGAKLSLIEAEKKANNFFAKHKSQLLHVKVSSAPKH